MIRIKIRLYKVHDYDLLSLYKTVGEREFSHIVRDVLRSYVEGTVYDPKGIKITVISEPGEKTPQVTCHLSIDGRLRKETALLSGIMESKRPAFIKALLRAYLLNVLAPVYFKEEQSYEAPLPKAEYKPTTLQVPVPDKFSMEQKTEQDHTVPDESKETEVKFDHSDADTQSEEDDGGMDDLAALFGGITIL